MKTAIKGDHTYSFFLPNFGHDWLFAHGASGCEFAVEIFDTVNAICGIYCELHSFEALGADDALETH
jgi:hypothetical protein